MFEEASLSRTMLEAADRVITLSRAMWAGEVIVLEPRAVSHMANRRGIEQLPEAWREVRRPMRGRLRPLPGRKRYAEAA